MHSSKAIKFLTKILPSVTLSQEVSVNSTSITTSLLSMPSGARQINVTVTGSRRQVTVNETLSSAHHDSTKREPLPSECWPDTRQIRLQWAPTTASVPRAARWHSIKGASLPSNCLLDTR